MVKGSGAPSVAAAQGVFCEVIKNQITRMQKRGMPRPVAVRKVLHCIAATSASQAPSISDVHALMKSKNLSRSHAERALVVKSELLRLKMDGFDTLAAIEELTKKMKTLDTKRKWTAEGEVAAAGAAAAREVKRRRRCLAADGGVTSSDARGGGVEFVTIAEEQRGAAATATGTTAGSCGGACAARKRRSSSSSSSGGGGSGGDRDRERGARGGDPGGGGETGCGAVRGRPTKIARRKKGS